MSAFIRKIHRILIIFSFGSVAALADAPTVTSVLNNLDYSTHLCPGIAAVIYGTNFGSSTSGVTVSAGGKSGFVVAVSSGQINAQLPFEASTGATNLTVTVAGVTSAPFAITLDAAAPAFATADGSGGGNAVAQDAAGNVLTSTVPTKPGDTVTIYMTGLGATNPPTATGPAAATNPTATMPTITVGGQMATLVFAGIVKGNAGVYQVNFKVPAVQGSQPIVVTVAGKSSSPPKPVYLLVFGISSVVSNASFGSTGTAAPGAIVTLFGNGFGITSQSIGFPSTTFQGISVTFNGTPAPIFALTITVPVVANRQLGQSQIDLLVPSELASAGVVQVAVKTPSATTPNYALTMAAATPGIYDVPDPSTKGRFNILAAFNGTVWLNMPASMADAYKYPTNCTANNVDPLTPCAQPAAPGDYLQMYVTGLGLATPNGDPNGKPLSTGNVAPLDGSVLYEKVAAPNLTIGGFPVRPVFSGIAPGFAGLYQVIFQVPAGVTGDDVPVALSIAGSAPDMHTMSIQNR